MRCDETMQSKVTPDGPTETSKVARDWSRRTERSQVGYRSPAAAFIFDSSFGKRVVIRSLADFERDVLTMRRVSATSVNAIHVRLVHLAGELLHAP